MISQAMRLAQEGRRNEAVRLLRRAVQDAPNNVRALKWLAYITPDSNEARRALARILQLAPDDVWAWQAWERLRSRKPRRRMSGLSWALLGLMAILFIVIAASEVMLSRTLNIAYDTYGEMAVANVSAIPSHEGVSVSTREEYYTITGDSVESIRRALDENGPYIPRLDDRVIATTAYEIAVNWSAAETSDGCAPQAVAVNLAIVYTYPYLDIPPTAPPEIPSMWSAFMRRVIAHEEHHGAIAQGCADDVVSAISGLPPQPDCPTLEALVNQTIAAQHEQCEARQLQFDADVGGENFP
jgi:predicted secreted Zn-dependent protease